MATKRKLRKDSQDVTDEPPEKKTIVDEVKESSAGLKDSRVKDPEAEDHGLKDPGVRDPGVKDPGVKGSEAEESGVKDPGIEDPGVKDPGVKDSGGEKLGVKDSGVEYPGVEEPTVKESGVEEPGVKDPEVEDSGVKHPDSVTVNHVTTQEDLDSFIQRISQKSKKISSDTTRDELHQKNANSPTDEPDGPHWFSRKKRDDPLSSYHISPTQQPVVFIFNNDYNRPGSDEDAKQLVELFQSKLQFILLSDSSALEMPVYKNLSGEKFKDTIQRITASGIFNNQAGVITIIMTHGDENSLYFPDNAHSGYHSRIDIRKDLIKPFCDDASLVGKPKVFILVGCRGPRHYAGVAHDNTDSLPRGADVLVAYSTSEGEVSIRNIDNGTWYVQEFVKVVRSHYKKYHIDEILTKVQNNVAEKLGQDGVTKVMPVFNSSLRKNFYLNLHHKKSHS